MSEYKKTKNCIDCGILIGEKADRCHPCAMKAQTGENHPMFKDGNTLNRICPDCGKPIGPQATRCRPCNYKWMSENKINPGNLKDGSHLQKFCIDCGKLLVKRTAKRCSDCYKVVLVKRLQENPTQKGRKHSIEQRIKNSLAHGGDGSLKPLNQGYAEDFNSELKRKIFERDNFTCQHPSCKRKCKLLTVHHIDYNKHNSAKSNLITLCRSCHPSTNFNRDEWKKYFENKMLILVGE